MSTDSNIRFLIIDPQGNEEMGVGNEVLRDVYTSFWKEAANSLLVREIERVPYVQHDLFKYEWEATGKILLKGYIDTGYFPVILSKAFVLYTLFGEDDVYNLLSSLFLYLSSVEAQKPHIIFACWKPMFNLLREEYHFCCKSHVFSYYDKVKKDIATSRI